MNRNVLKIIALISMLIDHLGYYIFDNFLSLRIIGRFAFPIFAFFVAEGMKYTRNRKRYILTLLIFAVVSQVPYALLNKSLKLNILFTFLISIVFILFLELLKKESLKKSLIKSILTILSISILFILCLVFGDILRYIDYALPGILLVVAFYFIKSKWKFVMASVLMVLYVLENLLMYKLGFSLFIQLFAIVSIILLLFYNGNKGKFNLKYLFYVFYPVHLIFIWIITLIL